MGGGKSKNSESFTSGKRAYIPVCFGGNSISFRQLAALDLDVVAGSGHLFHE
jgi:hypothetical protein